ncbi:MAG: hypothetical protein JSR17_13700 [Proteobacteria bacterium]|nr:hypothetical protein [Pseudomonadota bacterium]
MHNGPALGLELSKLNVLLHLALHFMDVKEPGLLRFGVYSEVYDYLSKKVIEAIDPKAVDHLKDLIQLVPTLLAEHPAENQNLFWGEIIKYYFQRASFFQDNPTAINFVRHFRRLIILQEHLKEHVVRFFQEQKGELQPNQLFKIIYNYRYANKNISRVFIQFIGQLIRDDNIEFAMAIHNFLHMAKRVAENRSDDECTITVNNGKVSKEVTDRIHGFDVVATAVAPCLIKALNLEGLFCEDKSYEIHFMKAMTFLVLQEPIFSQPFNVEFYANSRFNMQTPIDTERFNNITCASLSSYAVKVAPIIEGIKARVMSAQALALELKALSLSDDVTAVVNPLFGKSKSLVFLSPNTTNRIDGYFISSEVPQDRRGSASGSKSRKKK